jgi:hypothetical protein
VIVSGVTVADDTPTPVLDRGRSRTKTGRLWVYTRDDRPWAGPEPLAAVYFFRPGRSTERPAVHPGGFSGILHVDGYAGFERRTASGKVTLAACWAHIRSKFYELHEVTGSPIAAEALRRIAELYAIEEGINGRPAERRRRIRVQEPRPLVVAMKPWFELELGRVAQPPRAQPPSGRGRILGSYAWYVSCGEGRGAFNLSMSRVRFSQRSYSSASRS